MGSLLRSVKKRKKSRRLGAIDFRSCDLFSIVPERIPGARASEDTAQREHCIGPSGVPSHPDSLHPLLHNVAHGTFHGTAADVVAALSKRSVFHSMPVSLEVAGELVDLFVFGTMTLFQNRKPSITSSTASSYRRSSCDLRHCAASSVPSPKTTRATRLIFSSRDTNQGSRLDR